MAFRRKRRDTKIGTIEAQYGVDFGRRSDMKLGTLLDETGASSLTELVRWAKSPQATWPEAERKACSRRGLEHVGGPGAPDCSGDGTVVDVKHQRRPVTRDQVRRVAERPWAEGVEVEMVSASGYTDRARQEAAVRGVKLSRR